MQQLIDQGDWQGAQTKLQTITTTVATVDDVESKDQLVTQWQELTVKVEAQDAAATLAARRSAADLPGRRAVVMLRSGDASRSTGSCR